MTPTDQLKIDEIRSYFEATLCGAAELAERFGLSESEAAELIRRFENEAPSVAPSRPAAEQATDKLIELRLREMLNVGEVEEVAGGYGGSAPRVVRRKLDARDLKLAAETFAKLLEARGEGVSGTAVTTLRVEFVESCEVERPGGEG